MISSTHEARAQEVWFDADNLWVALYDGRKLSVPLTYFPRLLRATAKQRADVIISGGGIGLHWDEIDEDISVAGLLLGTGDQTKRSSH
ncbi:hypothetical protein CH370_02470 [Leptospira kmetyi]|uniref:DUF2442 domain-containing protein n=1 Tax=Leptospira kmetyi TaxID=408139 RepID=A0A2M9XVE1_9LEPT|nr:DUF2442 domain-containing protein [Leptospira kmetyi]AYV57022.1 DUF2442 domain-containing protein [Leptospira kmetyi]PJZ43312.1 hypothetical protein CH370_02470 [Leptospira kmetyi]TGK21614.1 DUF2442 domain-containing protein [Leptospira kmetyi]TGK28541.1 DUF2442 domain-containing protein [Leptospira kmetyi]TGL68091.1 DUF2442 domain-containing protein [Leptospira kmetyi]